MLFFIKASKAQKIMKKSEYSFKQEKMKKLNKMIKEAALSGKQYINFCSPLDEEIIKNLEKYGYKIEAKNYTYFVISW